MNPTFNAWSVFRTLIWQDAQELKTGDSIDFNCGQTHQIENLGNSPAKVLCVAVPLAL